jgi:endonuclease V-like protein UPF0215 family
MSRRLSHAIGFDDSPFVREHRGDVRVVGAVFAGRVMHGIVSTSVRRDGANATERLVAAIVGSKFRDQLQLIFLQGIALAGFNVVDLAALHERTGLPVIVVARRRPDLQAIRSALLSKVRGGAMKWKLIERAGEMTPMAGVFIQLAGISPDEAQQAIRRFAINGVLPEPLRVAHMIAGGIARGESGGRA